MATIIVIGAGISGLSATKELLQAGHHVILLEAADRAGGRVKNLPAFGKARPIPVSLGPQYLYGSEKGCGTLAEDKHNPLLPLLQEAKLTLKKIDPKSTTVFTEQGCELGMLSQATQLLPAATLSKKLLDEAMQHAKADHDKRVNSRKLTQQSQRQELETALAQLKLQTLPDAEKEQRLSALQDKLSQLINENCSMTTPAMTLKEALAVTLPSQSLWSRKLLAAHLISQDGYDYERDSVIEIPNRSGYEGGNEFVPETFQKLIDNLQTEITRYPSASCHFNTQVTEIDTTGEKAMVKTAESKTYQADYVICTVPLGVLKQNRILFNPPLSAGKQKAINNLEMSVMNTVILEFGTCFWDKSVTYIMLPHKDPDYVAACLNLKKFHPEANVLSVMFYGKEACHDTETLQAKAMELLRAAYKKEAKEPVTVAVTQWHTDPYTYGTWSVAGKNATRIDRVHLAAAEEKLALAGEHVLSGLNASLHAAWTSGRLAARSALSILAKAALGKKVNSTQGFFAASNTDKVPTEKAHAEQKQSVTLTGSQLR
jgi:monoamine oxidase